MSQNFGKNDYSNYLLEIEKKIIEEQQQSESFVASSKSGGERQNAGLWQSNAKKMRIKKLRRRRRMVLSGIVFAMALCVVFSAVKLIGAFAQDDSKKPDTESNVSNLTVSKTESNVPKVSYPNITKNTQELGSEQNSEHIIVVDLEKNTITAQKDAYKKAYPASTTKIMTLLVAVENITDLNDTFTMTYEITDPLFEAGATVAGFSAGEIIGMTDLLYGTILPSGGDAALGLAIKIAGSEANFVQLMNDKAEQLGLKNTHFTNVTGLFNKNHYTTAADMAVILQAAIKNELCKKILSTYKYQTASTVQHPEGIPLAATLFNYMYGDEPDGAQIDGGKTGFVNESGYCIAAFGHNDAGNEYIAVVLGAPARWPAFSDQIYLFSHYTK